MLSSKACSSQIVGCKALSCNRELAVFVLQPHPHTTLLNLADATSRPKSSRKLQQAVCSVGTPISDSRDVPCILPLDFPRPFTRWSGPTAKAGRWHRPPPPSWQRSRPAPATPFGPKLSILYTLLVLVSTVFCKSERNVRKQSPIPTTAQTLAVSGGDGRVAARLPRRSREWFASPVER